MLVNDKGVGVGHQEEKADGHNICAKVTQRYISPRGSKSSLVNSSRAESYSVRMSGVEKGGNRVTKAPKPRWQLDFSSR